MRLYIAIIIGLLALSAAQFLRGTAGSTEGPHVLEVTDGDTFEYGTPEDATTIRMVGIDTPERDQCFYEEAKDYLTDQIEGDQLKIVVAEEKLDDYGRTLAYVYEGQTFVNAELARQGYARYMTIAPNDKYADIFEGLVSNAIDENRGVWAECSDAMEWATS